MKRFPWIWALISSVLFFAPGPIYLFLVSPYARTTRDPDAVEVVGWFVGIFVIFLGVCSGFITAAITLQWHIAHAKTVSIRAID